MNSNCVQTLSTIPEEPVFVHVLFSTHQAAPVKVHHRDGSLLLEGPVELLDYKSSSIFVKSFIDCAQELQLLSANEALWSNSVEVNSRGANPQVELKFTLNDKSRLDTLKALVPALLLSLLDGTESPLVEGGAFTKEEIVIIDRVVKKTLLCHGGKRLINRVVVSVGDVKVAVSGKLLPKPDQTIFTPESRVLVGKFEGLSRRRESFTVVTKDMKTLSIHFGKRPISAAEIGAFMDTGDLYAFTADVTRKKNGAELFTLESYVPISEPDESGA